jgi:hypothetical protein
MKILLEPCRMSVQMFEIFQYQWKYKKKMIKNFSYRIFERKSCVLLNYVVIQNSF